MNISEVVAAMDFFGSSKVIVVPFDHGIARVTLPEKTLVMIHDGGAPSSESRSVGANNSNVTMVFVGDISN